MNARNFKRCDFVRFLISCLVAAFMIGSSFVTAYAENVDDDDFVQPHVISRIWGTKLEVIPYKFENNNYVPVEGVSSCVREGSNTSPYNISIPRSTVDEWRKAGATSFYIRLYISIDGSGLKGYELKSDNEVIGSSMSNVYFSYGWRTGFKGTTYNLTVYGTGGYSGNLSGNITVG